MTLPKSKEGFELGRSLFLNEELSDVEILVGTESSTCRYPCHKVILSAASEVFTTMFKSKLGEEETDQIIVNDINPDIMLILLTYVYSGRIDQENCNTSIEILRAAHKYRILSLIENCEAYLMKNLSLRNVCFILDIALLYDMNSLKEHCLKLCWETAFIVLKTRAFKESSANAVNQIICIKEELHVSSKMDVFQALWAWSTVACCKKQKKLTEENIFDEFSQFSEYVNFEVLTSSQLESLPKSVLEWISSKGALKSARVETESKETEIEHFVHFSYNLERYMIVVNFDYRFSQKETYHGNHLTFLRFSLNTDVYLLDFSVMPLNNEDSDNLLESFRLSSKNQTVADWSENNEGSLAFDHIGSQESCEDDCSEIQEFIFHSRRCILLEVDTEYTMEIKAKNSANSIMHWPRVFLKNDHTYCKEDIEILIHSQFSYAVTQMSFIRAY